MKIFPALLLLALTAASLSAQSRHLPHHRFMMRAVVVREHRLPSPALPTEAPKVTPLLEDAKPQPPTEMAIPVTAMLMSAE